MDIDESFGKLIGSMFQTYKGVRLEVVPNGYLLWGKLYASLKEVDEEIDKGFARLAEGINQLPANRLNK
jgi:hypothetical protein